MKEEKNITHPKEQELRALYEQGLEAPDARHLVQHVRDCTDCRRTLQRLRAFDRLLRRSMAEHAPKGLTHNVLRELGIPEEPSMAWRAFQYAAPLVALIILSTIVVGVFYFAGAFHQPEIQSGVDAGQSVYANAQKVLAEGSSKFSSSVKEYLPFMSVGRGTNLILFLVVFFVVIGVLDRLVFAPRFRKRSS